MEHFSTFQFWTHNSEKLSVCVKCECLAPTNYTHICNKWAPMYRNYKWEEIRIWDNVYISCGYSFTLLGMKFILDLKFYNSRQHTTEIYVNYLTKQLIRGSVPPYYSYWLFDVGWWVDSSERQVWEFVKGKK